MWFNNPSVVLVCSLLYYIYDISHCTWFRSNLVLNKKTVFATNKHFGFRHSLSRKSLNLGIKKKKLKSLILYFIYCWTPEMKVQDFKQITLQEFIYFFSRNKTTTTKSLRISHRLAWLSRYPGSRNVIKQDQGGPALSKPLLESCILLFAIVWVQGWELQLPFCALFCAARTVRAARQGAVYRLTLITSPLVWGDDCSYGTAVRGDEVYICPMKADIQKNQNYPWKSRKTQMNHKYKL